MSTMADLLFRVGKAMRNYGNPLGLGLQRLFPAPYVWVEDRRTALRFKCLRGADAMFPEALHSRHYDVPMAPVAEGDLVVDVGANHGFATCHFALRGATVMAYEPLPEVFELLVSNIARNGLQGRVNAVQAAITGLAGRVALRPTPAKGGGMSTTHEGYAAKAGVGYGAAIMVESRTLQDLIASVAPRRVRLVKLDCEGAELEILASLTPLDRERIDSFACEYHVRAYPLQALVDVLLSWDEFVFYKLPGVETTNEILHVVRRDIVRAWAAKAE